MEELKYNDLYNVDGGIDGEAAMKAVGSAVAIAAGLSAGAPVAVVGGCIGLGYYVCSTFK